MLSFITPENLSHKNHVLATRQRGGQYAGIRITGALLAAVAVASCGAMTEKVADAAMESLGVKAPGSARGQETKKVALRLDAARNINAGLDGQGLPTVVRLYKLRDPTVFLASPHASFGTREGENLAIGQDLLEVREFVLAPGQTLDLVEKMAPEAAYLGVVTMFRLPSAQRWRFAFATSEASSSGITLGLHACAMTATRAAPSGMGSESAFLLSPALCK